MSPLDTKVSGVLSTQITFVTTKEDPQISIPNNQERKARTLTCATKQNHPNTMCKERYIRLARKQNSPILLNSPDREHGLVLYVILSLVQLIGTRY